MPRPARGPQGKPRSSRSLRELQHGIPFPANEGQTWQRNACNQLVEQMERERCLGNTTMPYDDYRRQVEPKKD
jgi:hypothetical protein